MKLNKLIQKKLWSLISLPVSERNGGLFPFLLLGNGAVSTSAARFALALSREGWSDEKIHQSLKAVGRFYTFYITKYGHLENTIINAHDILGSYAEVRFRGSIDLEGNDNSQLFWPRINFSSVHKEIYYLNLFSDFCHRYFNSSNLNPKESRFIKIFKSYKDLRIQGLSDALIHLDGVRKGRRPRQFELNKRNIESKIKVPKYLTTSLLIDLIENGCKNPRDKILILLMGFGGLRISETLHIYGHDVLGTFPSTNASKILLAHPSSGLIQIPNETKLERVKRSTYLSNYFKRLPRNELGIGHIEYAGWKGMQINNQEPEQNYVFWLDELKTGTYFRKLLEEYLSDNRSLFIKNRLSHPYLFFNIQRSSKRNGYGSPLTYMNAQEIFYAACKRINLNGYSPHSCRHHYGFYSASILKVPPEVLQRQLRHKQITSTDIYYHISQELIRNEIIGKNNQNIDSSNNSSEIFLPTHWNYN
jgi:integrase